MRIRSLPSPTRQRTDTYRVPASAPVCATALNLLRRTPPPRRRQTPTRPPAQV